MSSLANIRNQEMYVGDFDVGYHGASCHGLAWSCTRKIGKAEALVVVLHQDSRVRATPLPRVPIRLCPHTHRPAPTNLCRLQEFSVFWDFSDMIFIFQDFWTAKKFSQSHHEIPANLHLCPYVPSCMPPGPQRATHGQFIRVLIPD